MRISVIGAGYVGIITGVCLAKLGNEVTLIDTDDGKVSNIGKKISPVYEEGLDELLAIVRIGISSDFQKVINSELILVCVGTPYDNDKGALLDQVEQATKEIGQALKKKKGYCVICVKSTVPPGTTEELVIPLLEKFGRVVGEDFGVCMSPEFLREGNAIHDFMNPARIIIGEYDKRSGDVLLDLHKRFGVPILRTDLKTAEMIKLASNSFLATKVSFINEIGNVCKKLGIDSYEVAKGIGLDDRIGYKFLNSGIGYGGSCLPKDIRMLISKAKEMGYEPKILREVEELNNRQALTTIETLRKHISLEGATIGLLGLAFKPGTDDVRDSPSIRIVQALLQEQAVIKAYDPMADENFRKLFPQIIYGTKEEVLNCDAILILTEWEEFARLDYRGKVVIDGRRIEKAREAMIYEGVCW